MRVVEVILASFIILFAMAFVNTFALAPSSSKYEVTDLEKMGYNVLHNLDKKGLLGRFVCNREWENLTAALMISLPPYVYFNLTVYDQDDEIVKDVLIRYGDSEVFESASFMASVKYVVPGYQEVYAPRVLVLQLVRG